MLAVLFSAIRLQFPPEQTRKVKREKALLGKPAVAPEAEFRASFVNAGSATLSFFAATGW
jgi:hypothetical protein